MLNTLFVQVVLLVFAAIFLLATLGEPKKDNKMVHGIVAIAILTLLIIDMLLLK